VTGKRVGYILVQWLPAALGVCGIALESTDMFSSQHTGNFLYALFSAAFGYIDPARFEIIHHLIRKAGHFVGYGTLSFLFFRALRNTVTTSPPCLWFSSVALTVLIASLDEWHQTYLPSRTGSLHDVLLDTLGAILVQTVVLITMIAHRRQAAKASGPQG
jgi:VanZ family protein